MPTTLLTATTENSTGMRLTARGRRSCRPLDRLGVMKPPSTATVEIANMIVAANAAMEITNCKKRQLGRYPPIRTCLYIKGIPPAGALLEQVGLHTGRHADKR